MAASLLQMDLHRALLLALGLGAIAATSADTSTSTAASSVSHSIATDRANPTFLAAAPRAAAAVSTTTIVAAAASGHVVPDFGKLPIRFEPNVGQVPAPIKYFARSDGYQLALTEQGLILSVRHIASFQRARSSPEVGSSPVRIEHALVRLSLVHGKHNPQIHAEQQQNSISNYFIGNDRSTWHSNVPNYGLVRYERVYPGIDWVVYGNPQQLEYDFVVAPHAEPRQIRLMIRGADVIALADNGDLVVKIQNQTLRQVKPVIYQANDRGKRRNIEGHYVLEHGEVTFALGPYDRTRQLIIDPAFVYSTYLGGSADTQANGIAVDDAGNAYVAGTTASSDFPTSNPLQKTNNELGNTGDATAFIAKFNSSGSALLYIYLHRWH